MGDSLIFNVLSCSNQWGKKTLPWNVLLKHFVSYTSIQGISIHEGIKFVHKIVGWSSVYLIWAVPYSTWSHGSTLARMLGPLLNTWAWNMGLWIWYKGFSPSGSVKVELNLPYSIMSCVCVSLSLCPSWAASYWNSQGSQSSLHVYYQQEALSEYGTIANVLLSVPSELSLAFCGLALDRDFLWLDVFFYFLFFYFFARNCNCRLCRQRNATGIRTTRWFFWFSAQILATN